MAEWMPKAEYKTTEYYLHIRDAMLTERLLASLCTLFGAVAALLSSLGLYGILSYTLAQRRGEIGIRMALGASAYHLKRWVFHHGMAPVALGCAAGLMISRWVATFVQSQLFGIDASDWRVSVLALVPMALVAIIAVAIPALRSARVNPAEILRHE
jgi:ABC-type antimicrobial peptide transport system permease subunit